MLICVWLGAPPAVQTGKGEVMLSLTVRAPHLGIVPLRACAGTVAMYRGGA